MSTIYGGDGDNNLIGTDGDDQLYGEGGFDSLYDSLGADLLDGGDGNDTLYADFEYYAYDFNLGRFVLTTNLSPGDQFVGGGDLDTLRLRSSQTNIADFTQTTIAPDIESIWAENATARLTFDQLAQFESLNGKFLVVGSGTHLAYGGRLQGELTLGDGDDVASLEGGSGQAVLHGGGGDDTITAGDYAGVNRITGDDGNDRLYASTPGPFGFDGAILEGGSGDDVLTGDEMADHFAPGTGSDIVIGGGGDDVMVLDYRAGAEADQISLGSGVDTIFLISLPDAPLVFDLGAGTIGSDVEIIYAVDATLMGSSARLNQFQSIIAKSVRFTDAVNIVPSDKFDVGGYELSDLGGSVDASASDTRAYRLIGAGGDDILTGSSANDTLYSGAGSDVLAGGNGNDGLYFGAGFGAGDTADGGAGTDTIALQGNYAGTSLAGISAVEVLLLASGADTRFGDTAGNLYTYELAIADAVVAAGQTFTIVATDLRIGEDAQFDGSAETDGHFRIFAGQGDDDLKGGAGNDGFFFGADNNLTASDRIDGGAGTDTIALRGDHSGANAIAFDPASFTGVEILTFLSSHSNEYGGQILPVGFDYDVTLADANLSPGASLDVIAGNLRSDETFRFDGRAETNGSLRIISGAGDDILFGGSGGDTLYGGLGADQIDGGAGADTYVYRSVRDSTAASRDTIVFGAGDRIDLSLIDAVDGAPANQAFAFIGSAAFSNSAGELRAWQSGASWLVEGDVDGDGTADFVLAVTAAAPLTVSDFVL